MHVPCRSAVKDEDEWPSKYSKFFIEVQDVTPLMSGMLELFDHLVL